MTNYRAGATFERAVIHHLTGEGFWCTRSAGSKTAVDIVSIKAGQLLLVQVKRDGRISPAERQALTALAGLIDCAIPILAYKHAGSSRIHLAELTGPGVKDRRPFHTDLIGGPL